MTCARVLVIATDPALRGALSDLLDAGGLGQCAMASRSEALGLLASGCVPSVLVIDMEYPPARAAHLIGLLRNVPRLKDVPVLVTTALRLESVPEDVEAVLLKPFSRRDFDDAVARLMARSDGRDSRSRAGEGANPHRQARHTAPRTAPPGPEDAASRPGRSGEPAFAIEEALGPVPW